MSTRPHLAAIALGSNLGDRLSNINCGIDGLAKLPGSHVVARGPVIASAPLQPPADGTAFTGVLGSDYLNSAVLLSTGLTPSVLLRECQHIERLAGRDRSLESRRWMPRVLDLDLILYDEEQIELPGLKVPHPGLRDRSFVLEPLAAIWPEARVLPDLRTVGEIWREVQLSHNGTLR